MIIILIVLIFGWILDFYFACKGMQLINSTETKPIGFMYLLISSLGFIISIIGIEIILFNYE